MTTDAIQTAKLAPNQAPPERDDLLVELTLEKSGGWTAAVVSDLLSRAQAPGTHFGQDEALTAAVKYLARQAQGKTVYFRAHRAGIQDVKARRSARRR